MNCDHCGQSTKVCGQADTGNVCEDCLNRAKEKDKPKPVPIEIMKAIGEVVDQVVSGATRK